jgi:hypothetical protein
MEVTHTQYEKIEALLSHQDVNSLNMHKSCDGLINPIVVQVIAGCRSGT